MLNWTRMPLSPQKEKQTETQIYLKVCLLFFLQGCPRQRKGWTKSIPLSPQEKQISLRSLLFLFAFSAGWTFFQHISTSSKHESQPDNSNRDSALLILILGETRQKSSHIQFKRHTGLDGIIIPYITDKPDTTIVISEGLSG